VGDGVVVLVADVGREVRDRRAAHRARPAATLLGGAVAAELLFPAEVLAVLASTAPTTALMPAATTTPMTTTPMTTTPVATAMTATTALATATAP
jgi:hypothetical protein